MCVYKCHLMIGVLCNVLLSFAFVVCVCISHKLMHMTACPLASCAVFMFDLELSLSFIRHSGASERGGRGRAQAGGGQG